jgi:uncharacterized protein
VSNPHSPLRLNVGFLIGQAIGYSREFPFDVARISLPPDLVLTNLTGVARLTRTPQGLLSQIKMQASATAECGRCLVAYQQPLTADITELYAFTQRTATETGLILPEDGHIDLEPLVREYMLLEMPINPLCRPDCKGLCSVCGGNLNEFTCHHEATSGDPRLDGLRNLLDKKTNSQDST